MGNSCGWRCVFSTLVIMAIFLTSIPAVSAYSVNPVTEPSKLLQSGEVITVSVSDLKVGDHFKYRLTSSDLDTMGGTIISNNVYLPFGFQSYPVTHLSTTGYSLEANPLTVDYNNGDVFFNPTYPANTNPIDITKVNIHAGDYVLTLKGTKIPGATTTIDYSVGGIIDTISKPDPQLLTFTIKNANSGHLTIEVFDGAVLKFSETYTIVSPPPAPTPSGSDDDGPVVPEEPVEIKGPQLAPPGFPSSSLTLLHNDEGRVLAGYTLDTDSIAGFIVKLNIEQGTEILTGAGKPVDEITLTPLEPAAVPDDTGSVYSILGIAVECEQSGITFHPENAVTLSFILSSDLWTDTLAKVGGDPAAMMIGFYEPASGTWIVLPTTVDPVTHTLSAPITHFSTYGLISESMNEVPGTSSQTTGGLISPIPTESAAAGIPAATPVKTQLAPPEPNQSPGLPGLTVISTVLFVGYCIMRKK